MKKLLFSLFFGITFLLGYAQAPQSISYQGVARNSSGTILSNQNIGIKLDLHQGSSVGSVVFSETHNSTTNNLGLFTLGIGSTNATSFSSINWANGPYFLEVSIDPTGGTSFISVGMQQFMSVPYALYAQTAGNSSATPTITINAPNTVTSAGGSYTINVPTSVTYSAGTGIDITGGIISNTLTPSQTTITSTGIAFVSPTTGNNFNVDVPVPVLNYTSGTNVLSLTQGTTVTTATLNGTGSNTVSIVGSGIAAVTPTTGSNFTVSVPNPTLSIASGSISISGGNSVALPVSTTYTNGAGISITSGSIIANTAPNQTVNITSGNALLTVGGTYPNYTLTPITASLTGLGNAIVMGSYPSQAINVPAASLTYTSATNVLKLTDGSSVSTVTLNSSPWSAPTATSIVSTNSLSLVGIGTSSPTYKLDVYGTGSVPATIHGYNSGATVSSTGVFGENPNNGIGVFGQSNIGAGVWGKSTSGAGVYGESTSGDAGKFILSSNTTTANAVNAQTNGTGAALFAKSFNATAIAAIFEGKVKIVDGTQGASKVLTSDAAGNASWQVITAAASPWVQGVGTTTLTNINDKVGIGTNTPNSLLHVENNTAFDGLNINNNSGNGNAMQVNQLGSGYGLSLNINNVSGAHVLKLNTNGSGEMINAIKTSSLGGFASFISSNANNSSTLLSLTNAGSGKLIDANNTSSTNPTAYFSNSSGNALEVLSSNGRGILATVASTSAAVEVTNNSTGEALYAKNTNASTTAYAGNFDGGIITKGKSTTVNDYAFRAYNSASTPMLSVRDDSAIEIIGNVGINILNPTNKLHINSSFANAAVLAENTTAISTASLAHGIYAKASSTHTMAAAVYAENLGTGSSFYAIKNGTAGIAGRFEILNSSNSADAIYVNNLGKGAAIHAVSGPTVSGSSNVALWLEAGHLKSTQPSVPSVTTVSTNISFSTGSYTLTSATDVKGSLLAACTGTSSPSVYSGSAITFKVTFNKAYQLSPTVVVTPTSDLNGLAYFVSNITTTSFNITVKNSTSSTITLSPTYGFSFNYFVIE